MIYQIHSLILVIASLATSSTGQSTRPADEPAPAPPTTSPALAYDPLQVNTPSGVLSLDLTVRDEDRQRDIPVLVYLPAQKTPAPVILFSHGLGGARTNNRFLGEHWAARGYVAVFVQHPGSDESVWKNKSKREARGAMRRAANKKSFDLRVRDIPVVLDQLERWNVSEVHAHAGRMDLSRIGISGHSFGAITTQAVSGESLGLRKTKNTDPRIDAAVMFSPSAPKIGRAERAFGTVKIPWMLMTGTNDKSPIGRVDVSNRLAVFPALPPGSKYEVVLDGAEHSAFGDSSSSGRRDGRNPNHHRVMLALTTAFFDAWLRDDAAARTWLDGDGPRTVLESADRWQKK